MSTQTALDDRLAWLKERAARAQSQASISITAPSVIEQISTPYISPHFQPVAGAPIAKVAINSEALLPTKEVQYQALERMGLLGLKTRADDVFLIVATACRAGAADLTGREIQVLYERRYGRRIESGTISARVNELITAQRFFRRGKSRECTVTHEMAAPVYVVAKQVRMGY